MVEWTDEWMDGPCLVFCCCSAADEDDDDGDDFSIFNDLHLCTRCMPHSFPNLCMLARLAAGYDLGH